MRMGWCVIHDVEFGVISGFKADFRIEHATHLAWKIKKTSLPYVELTFLTRHFTPTHTSTLENRLSVFAGQCSTQMLRNVTVQVNLCHQHTHTLYQSFTITCWCSLTRLINSAPLKCQQPYWGIEKEKVCEHDGFKLSEVYLLIFVNLCTMTHTYWTYETKVHMTLNMLLSRILEVYILTCNPPDVLLCTLG